MPWRNECAENVYQIRDDAREMAAVATWAEIATAASLSRTSQAAMAPAFRLAD